MPVESTERRPIFANGEAEILTPPRTPVSPIAIVACLLGLASFLATLSFNLVAIPALAIATGLISYWQLSRSDTHSGKWLSTAGVGLGLLFAVWSLTHLQLRDRYVYAAGGEFAIHFLKVLGEEKPFHAYELTKIASERQLPGVDIDQVYKSLPEEPRHLVEGFTQDPVIKEIMSRGTAAQWELVRGQRVESRSPSDLEVSVRLQDVSQAPPKEVTVRLMRRKITTVGNIRPAATWHVLSVRN
jgi:hypothetical protein